MTYAHVREIAPGTRLSFGTAALRAMHAAPSAAEGERVALSIMRARRADRGLVALAHGYKRSIPPVDSQ